MRQRSRHATPRRATSVSPAVRAIWQVVASLPVGTTASYGEVAVRAGVPRAARLVGHALRSAPASLALPWHRVVAAGGRIALAPGTRAFREQCRRLRAEGVRVTNGRVERGSARSLNALLWDLRR
jgi:methylated-DNA-protein-cysteine methyltransferase related protein